MAGLQELIEEQRQVAQITEEADDQGSTDLVIGYVQAQEKLVWMYNAFLGWLLTSFSLFSFGLLAVINKSQQPSENTHDPPQYLPKFI